MVRAGADHVDVRLVGPVGADEADQEADQPAVAVLGHPRRPGEVLEPQAREQLVHVPPAPPVVDAARRAARGRPRSAVGAGCRRSPGTDPGDDRRRERAGPGRAGRTPRRDSRGAAARHPRSGRTATGRADRPPRHRVRSAARRPTRRPPCQVRSRPRHGAPRRRPSRKQGGDDQQAAGDRQHPAEHDDRDHARRARRRVATATPRATEAAGSGACAAAAAPSLGGAVAIRRRMGESSLAGRRRRSLLRRPASAAGSAAGPGAADGSVEVTRPS